MVGRAHAPDVAVSAPDLVLDELEALVFDFDGVILESAGLKGDAFLELFADHPEHLDAIRAHHLENLGVSRFDKFDWIYRNLLKRPLSEDESLKLGRGYARLVVEKTATIPFVPGALEVLESLAGRKPLYVASATPHEELLALVERRGLDGFFERVVGSPPDKATVLAGIVRDGGYDPRKVLMIGDGMTDYLAARACGCPFVARIDPAAPAQPFPDGVPGVADLVALEALW